MQKLGNENWNLLTSDDILDYKIHTNNNNENKDDLKQSTVECKTRNGQEQQNNNNNNSSDSNNNDNNSNNNNNKNNNDINNNNNNNENKEVDEKNENTNSSIGFKKHVKHFPKILPIGQRVKVPGFLYTKFDFVQIDNNLELEIINLMKIMIFLQLL